VLTNRFRFGAVCSVSVAVATWVGLSYAQGKPETDADVDVEVNAAPAGSTPPAPAPSTSAPAAPTASAPAPAPATPPAPSATGSQAPVAGAGVSAVAPPSTSAAATAETKAAEPLVEIGGYAQVEYQSHNDSEEQLTQTSNTTLNQNRFLLRRGRLTAKRAWQYTSLELELDGNTTNGPAFGIYRAEASAFYRSSDDKTKAPLAQLTLGMFRLPFGFELPQSAGVRWFMERTQLSRALFPTEIDLGGRLSGEAGPFRYAAAVTNGEPLGEKSGFQLQDPNKNKDFTISVGAKGSPVDVLTVSGGISANKGRGFHPGTSATKATATWNDQNENGIIDPGTTELLGTAAQAAVKSQTFERWAVGADLSIDVKTPIGTGTVFGEVVAAKNMDRGFFPADPISAGSDLREFGYFVGVLQQITEYGIVGFRVDFYDPNADVTDKRAGKTLPSKNTVTTYSPLIGVTLPKRARLSFQYDIIKDYLARDTRGVPANLDNDAWTLRLQVNL
jgi:hypothetical protein